MLASGSKTIVNNILGMAGSAASISHPRKPMSASEGSWRVMQLTQPPTTSDFLVANFIALSAIEAVALAKDRFVPSNRSVHLESNYSMTHSSFSRLGAVHLENAGGLTLEMAAEGIAQLQERFEEAEHKGRQLRFF
ncbi:hypothetical protein DOTSEDRAFT_25741 [Dothistroma septosporum NZE10]|uniref:Uncharacterized protein n=1 Tax=Dothistroma septosporum (strain NZE10 / CBS 128990) TaxID=675120 RepID=N1PIZ9_DOTSN|nr:hypothetical protein DOTSEDRAFT_25741 [Dothistroma septosporum NZE10]